MPEELAFFDSEIIELKSSPDHGRGYYAKTKIEPGTTIIVEYPFASTIKPDFINIVCNYCTLVHDPNLLMNDHTTTASKNKNCSMKKCAGCKLQYYCSAACQKAAWLHSHKFECKILKEIGKLPKSDQDLLILRSIIKADKNPDLERNLQMINLEPKYESLNFQENNYKNEINSCYEYCKDSKLCNDIFSSLIKKYPKNYSDPYSIILEFATRLQNNRMGIGPIDQDFLGQSSGTAIYPKITLANHSCRPNALWQTYKNMKNVLRVVKKIEPGQEILVTYLDTTKTSKNRKAELWLNYHFVCDCTSCNVDSADHIYFDGKQNEGGIFDELVEKGEVDKISSLPVFNSGVMRQLQESFNEMVRTMGLHRQMDKTYDIGVKLWQGMDFYLSMHLPSMVDSDYSSASSTNSTNSDEENLNSRFKIDECYRPDFSRACAVHLLMLADIAVRIKMSRKTVQDYVERAENILKITDDNESKVFQTIDRLKAAKSLR